MSGHERSPAHVQGPERSRISSLDALRVRVERAVLRKRVFDSVAVVMISPFLLIVAVPVAVIVRLSLGSPVIYRQQRAGRYGAPFTLLKFRTMRSERKADGTLRSREERHTKVGDLLRTSSLDELPQLLNVAIGDMSLVGPRPLLPEYLPFYTRVEGLRHAVRPGVTGPAQTGGRNGLSWDRRLLTDIEYVEGVSLRADWRVLVTTVRQVARRSGAEADPSRLGERLDTHRSYPRDGSYALRRLLHSDLETLASWQDSKTNKVVGPWPTEGLVALDQWLTVARADATQTHLLMYEIASGIPRVAVSATREGALGAWQLYTISCVEADGQMLDRAMKLIQRYLETSPVAFR